MRRFGPSLRSLAGAMTIAFCCSAYPFSIVLNPASGTHASGSPFDVAIIIQGLESDGQLLSTFDLDLAFDPAQLQFIAAKPGDAMCAGGDCAANPPAFFNALAGPGGVNLFALAAASDADLAAVQDDSFAAAVITLAGVMPGQLFPVDIGSIDALGGAVDPVSQFTVDLRPLLSPDAPPAHAAFTIAARAVPEPSSLVAASLSLLLLAAMRVRKHR